MVVSPGFLRDSTEMAGVLVTDVLSDVFEQVEVQGMMTGGFAVRGPPALEHRRVGPVRGGDDLAVTGGPVVVARTVVSGERGVESIEGRRVTDRLEAEVGHHDLVDGLRVAGDVGGVGRA